jgi:hypothetical protein
MAPRVSPPQQRRRRSRRDQADPRDRREQVRGRSGTFVRARLWSVVVLCAAALLAPTWTYGRGAWSSVRSPHALPTDDLIVQSHPRGCGAALLATLLTRRGIPVDEAELLADAPPGPSGISLATLARMAADRGLHGTWRRAPRGTVPAPGFVAHLSKPNGHFVWIASTHGDYLVVDDPARGRSLWHEDRFRTRFSGRYLRFGGADGGGRS